MNIEELRLADLEFLSNVDESSENKYYPFLSSEYPYRKKADIMSETWSFMENESIKDIVPINPYSKSKFRHSDDALAIWDSAIGVPSNKIRSDNIISQKALTVNKVNNHEWCDVTIPNLARVGYLDGSGKFLRPKGDNITDLMYTNYGWKILEGAHMLAHKFSEGSYLSSKSSKYVYGRNASTMIDFIIKLCAAIKFNLPVDVEMTESSSDRFEDTNDGFNRYGIGINSSAQFRSPILSVPAIGNDAIAPDTTVAILCGSVHIEPHPHSINLEQNNWKEINRWSCHPSMCVLAGWDFIDVITHQPITHTWWSDDVYYSMLPGAMKEISSFNKLIELAKSNRGEAKADNIRYWHPLDWFESDSYKSLMSITPSLPCKECVRLNMKAEGAPERPRCKMPEKDASPNSMEVKEWNAWDEKIQNVLGIVETATLYYESRKLGMTKAKRLRKDRNKNYKERQKIFAKIDKLNKACKKLYDTGRISKLESTLQEIDDLTAQLQ
jgi:hypothetical protein